MTIHPSQISGTIHAPSSKSSMQRACAAAILNNGVTIIKNAGHSNDEAAAVGIIVDLGAKVVDRVEEGLRNLHVTSTGSPKGGRINCGESGLALRMFAPISALQDGAVLLEGEGSLLKRPMHLLDEVLPQLGVQVNSNGGKLPIRLKGPLIPKAITVDGSVSSQFLTGILFAISHAATSTVEVKVTDLKSKPYIDLTLKLLEHFGHEVTNNEYHSFIVKPRNKNETSPIEYIVEGDWSSASFILVAGAIAGDIEITGLDLFSSQADKAILQALIMTGARLSIEPERITVARPIAKGKLKAFHFNAMDCPDLFPPLAALAAYCDGTSVIEGVSRLLHKESNRSLSIMTEFAKMGVDITLQDDLMLVKGGNLVKGAVLGSHNDHRITMALSVTALAASGQSTIEGAEAINKSYPDFFYDLEKLHAGVSLIHQTNQ